MRILLLAISHYRDRMSGSARVVWDEAQELTRRGHEVWILAPGRESQEEHEMLEEIHLLRYRPAAVRPWNPARGFGHQRAATAVLSRYLPRVDAVHGHVPLSYRAALDLYQQTARCCYTVHSPVSMEMAIQWKASTQLRKWMTPVSVPLVRRIERECLRRSQAITALSQYTIDCMARIHGEAIARRIRRIPGWVDTLRFAPMENQLQARVTLDWPLEVPVFFTLRRLVARMGLDRLLAACALLRARGCEFALIIGGAGPLRGALEEQAATLGLKSVVRFLGRVEDEELPLAYRACDAFVLPTAELECFGLIMLEALAAGRPVLATPVSAIPEMLNRFDPAWLARSATAESIAELLYRFLQGDIRAHAPEDLQEQVRREYGRERIVAQLVEYTVCGDGESLGTPVPSPALPLGMPSQ